LPELEVTYPNGQAHRSSVSSSLFEAESLRIGGIAERKDSRRDIGYDTVREPALSRTPTS
jgi:hypothetical protein